MTDEDLWRTLAEESGLDPIIEELKPYDEFPSRVHFWVGGRAVLAEINGRRHATIEAYRDDFKAIYLDGCRYPADGKILRSQLLSEEPRASATIAMADLREMLAFAPEDVRARFSWALDARRLPPPEPEEDE